MVGFKVVVVVDVVVVVGVVVVVVEVEVDGVGFVGFVTGAVVDIVVVVVVDVVVAVVVVVEVDGVGCSPSQHVSSDAQVLGLTQAFAEIQNKSSSVWQDCGYPTSP